MDRPDVFWMLNLATNKKPLLAIINSKVMLTNNNLKVRSTVTLSTVSCCEDGSAAQDRSSTEGDRATGIDKPYLEQHISISYNYKYAHLPRVLIGFSLQPTNYSGDSVRHTTLTIFW